MQSKRIRLDRLISLHLGINRREVHLLLAQGRVWVDGNIANNVQQLIDEFMHVSLDGQVLQAKTPRYIMMHKPAGVVSATRDAKHKTIINLLPENDNNNLHIVGRLDFNSTGLLLLTNDGRWSRMLTLPEHKITKRYRVVVKHKLTEEYSDYFLQGMYFSYENITTKPAKLTIISDYIAEVSLTEGRYHQIKRMFGRFQNPVLALHRIAIGNLQLDNLLKPGQSRELTTNEVNMITHAPS